MITFCLSRATDTFNKFLFLELARLHLHFTSSRSCTWAVWLWIGGAGCTCFVASAVPLGDRQPTSRRSLRPRKASPPLIAWPPAVTSATCTTGKPTPTRGSVVLFFGALAGVLVARRVGRLCHRKAVIQSKIWPPLGVFWIQGDDFPMPREFYPLLKGPARSAH